MSLAANSNTRQQRRAYYAVRLAAVTWLILSPVALNPVAADSVRAPGASRDGPIAPASLSKPVDVRVLRQELSQVLQSVAEQAGFKVTLSKGLTRPLTDLHLKGEARAALDQLADVSGAVWWWTGSDIRFVDRAEQITRTLKGRDLELTLESARTLGIPIDLVTVQRSDVPGLVRVTAPAAIVEDLETLAKDVAEQVNKIQVTRYGRRRAAQAK
jgi:hypothetical protein